MKPTRCPTGEECTTNALIEQPDGAYGRAVACWYPQMGGYTSKCVVIVEDPDTCFSAWIWSDGEFPFDGDSGIDPVRLHHCSPDQFVTFGELVRELQER